MTRMRFGLRHLAAILGLTVAALPPVVLADAPAAHAAVCSPGSGVSVIVDFGALGSVKSGCASGAPSTGLKALSGAGFSYSYVPGQTGMVCRINSLPDPCPSGGPPVDKYWSYWVAERGGTWKYSSKGAGNRTPPVGSVDGWAFGAGKPPATAPPAKGSSSGGGGDSDGGGDGSGDGGGSGGGGKDDGGSKKSGKPGDPSASDKKKDRDSPSASGSGSQTAPGAEDPAADPGSGSDGYDNASNVGSQMGTVGGIFGAGIVLVLLAALGWRTWQRRRGETEPVEAAEPSE
ncbi:hypothetical protein [Stackebrandtia nassauensis]|uniref:Uncharacterized protein n=1 Tax=Stackebrandtia nassauensis (strain DSM 44728 / CIP 108903 / NRRL B-16338 / NBRC 102104 / LLR-40K-21) TaxID=446470 RepID=D3QAJ7_STANL|nr:hypothetical protein [Stackebrandtia nassauensis]ADD42780.1 conserved hypothetical protein [Stackebrandtia nassauensis DSM 44728]